MNPQHTDSEYEAELCELRDSLLMMGARAEAQLSRACDVFLRNDKLAAQRVVQSDSQFDSLEVEVDEACLRLLAKRQPVAGDLRFVMSTFKIVRDLEGVGDLAKNIASLVAEGVPALSARLRSEVQGLGEGAVASVKEAMDALVDRDAVRAAHLVGGERRLDALASALRGTIAEEMRRDGALGVEDRLRLLSVVRCLESAGDHSANIAEMTVFLAKGRRLREVRQRLPFIRSDA